MKKYLFALFLLSLAMVGCSSFKSKTVAAEPNSVGASPQQQEKIIKNMEDSDRLKLSERLEGLPLGDTDFWQNGNTSASYTVTPIRNFNLKDNPYCRQFRLVENMADESQVTTSSACRQANGLWRIES